MSLSEATKIEARLPEGINQTELVKEARSWDQVIIVKTMWYRNELITPMQESALAYLRSIEVPAAAIRVEEIPGSFEMPQALSALLEYSRPQLVVLLGAVIRGETPHFDFVCQSAAQGITQITHQKALSCGVGFGLLTVDNLEQAQARISKGAEAAQAAALMRVKKAIWKRKSSASE